MSLRRIILVILGVIALIVSLKTANSLIENKPEPPKVVPKAAKKLVKTMEVVNENLHPQTLLLGKVTARNRIEVFAEVNGKLNTGGKEFREGVRFSRGEAILHLDDEEQRMTLSAQKTAFIQSLANVLPDIRLDFPDRHQTWESYARSLDERKSLPELPAATSEQEKLFLAARNITNQYYTIKSAEARLEKYRILAPFDGIVSQTLVDPGALVRAGQKMGEFIGEGGFEVEASVSFNELDFLEPGDSVRFTSKDVSGSWKGEVIRISDYLDPATQTVRVFCSVKGQDLKDGMYLDGTVYGDQVPNCLRISRSLLYPGDVVYALNDSTLRAIEVKVVKKGENQALVQGVPDGTLLIREPVNNAYDGMPVTPDR